MTENKIINLEELSTGYRLLLTDCLKVIKTIPDESIDLIVTVHHIEQQVGGMLVTLAAC